MTPARARLGIVILVLGAGLIGASLWITVRRSNPLQALKDDQLNVDRLDNTIAIARVRETARAAPPVARGDSGSPGTAEGMSQGLAQDLEMFNSDQLQAELESIALSYPLVTLVTAFCAARPCYAEVASQDVEQLNQYVEMVTSRFQGHVATQFETRGSPAGRRVLYAAFTIGTPARHALARYSAAL